jgi:8-oxo-dGTP pyrophosphatase MutT (NUDIX family)
VTERADFRNWVRERLANREPVRSHDESLIPASVLLPLFAPGPQSEPELWLLRRAEELRTHRGQVALPGGRRDPTDADLIATALREAHEEIGLAPSEVEVLGVLDDCVTITGFAVTPYVGWIGEPFTPRPLPTEVARVFSAPLSAFRVDPRAMTVPWGTSKRIVLSYEAAGEVIWGATASILRGFMQALGEGDPAPPRFQ